MGFFVPFFRGLAFLEDGAAAGIVGAVVVGLTIGVTLAGVEAETGGLAPTSAADNAPSTGAALRGGSAGASSVGLAGGLTVAVTLAGAMVPAVGSTS